MRLKDYIRQVGDEQFAKKLSTKGLPFTTRAAMSWRLGDRVPNRRRAKVIVAKTPVTYEGIYGTTE